MEGEGWQGGGWQAAGGRRQAAGGRRQAAGGGGTSREAATSPPVSSSMTRYSFSSLGSSITSKSCTQCGWLIFFITAISRASVSRALAPLAPMLFFLSTLLLITLIATVSPLSSLAMKTWPYAPCPSIFWIVYWLSFFNWLLSFDDLVSWAVPSFTTWSCDGSRARTLLRMVSGMRCAATIVAWSSSSCRRNVCFNRTGIQILFHTSVQTCRGVKTERLDFCMLRKLASESFQPPATLLPKSY